MLVSAIMILIYHLWINVTNYEIESFIKWLFIIGVDLFFFVSSYSISKNNINYKDFIINRFKNIYIKFIILSIIYVLYNNKSIIDLFKIIFMVDLFIKGGGSFLWFIPCIMIVYIILPLYKKIDSKKTFIITIISYIIIGLLFSNFINYKSLFIFYNRIPIILIGYYFYKYDVINKINKYYLKSILLIIIGLIISYIYFNNNYIISWYKEVYYLINIPLELGLILLIDRINENNIINYLSSITLELYGLQMIFGFKIANSIFKIINIPLLSNIITIIILIVISILFNYIFKLFYKLIDNKNRIKN